MYSDPQRPGYRHEPGLGLRRRAGGTSIRALDQSTQGAWWSALAASARSAKRRTCRWSIVVAIFIAAAVAILATVAALSYFANDRMFVQTCCWHKINNVVALQVFEKIGTTIITSSATLESDYPADEEKRTAASQIAWSSIVRSPHRGMVIEEAHGWPMRCLSWSSDGQTVRGGIAIVPGQRDIHYESSAKSTMSIGRLILPLRPIWRGVAVDLCIYTVFVFGAYFTFRLSAGILRAWRGQCVDCSYSLHGLAANQCPECGSRRS